MCKDWDQYDDKVDPWLGGKKFDWDIERFKLVVNTETVRRWLAYFCDGGDKKVVDWVDSEISSGKSFND